MALGGGGGVEDCYVWAVDLEGADKGAVSICIVELLDIYSLRIRIKEGDKGREKHYFIPTKTIEIDSQLLDIHLPMRRIRHAIYT